MIQPSTGKKNKLEWRPERERENLQLKLEKQKELLSRGWLVALYSGLDRKERNTREGNIS